VNAGRRAADSVSVAIEILITEDSSTQAERLRYLLEQHHYKVMVAEDGTVALEWLADHLPAMVITDINMPRLNGYDLCRRIKADSRLRDIPVILLTSLSDAMDVLEGLACGADSFITKPYSEDYLVARVEHTLADARLPHSRRPSIRVEIPIPGQLGVVTADPQRMVSLLISTYEAAIYRNTELAQTQDALRALNENLEDIVEDRTAVLTAEIAERQQAEGKIRYLAGVLENVSDGIVSLDLHNHVVTNVDGRCLTGGFVHAEANLSRACGHRRALELDAADRAEHPEPTAAAQCSEHSFGKQDEGATAVGCLEHPHKTLPRHEQDRNVALRCRRVLRS